MQLTIYTQMPRKHFRKWRGAFVYMTKTDQNYFCRSRAERKFLKIWSHYNGGNGLYRLFTTAKRALSLQKKRASIQEILFSFFKKNWGADAPIAPRFRGPWPYHTLRIKLAILVQCVLLEFQYATRRNDVSEIYSIFRYIRLHIRLLFIRFCLQSTINNTANPTFERHEHDLGWSQSSVMPLPFAWWKKRSLLKMYCLDV
jgi:hypothetical protein